MESSTGGGGSALDAGSSPFDQQWEDADAEEPGDEVIDELRPPDVDAVICNVMGVCFTRGHRYASRIFKHPIESRNSRIEMSVVLIAR